MTKRRPTETYYLVLTGLFVVVFAFFTLFAGVMTAWMLLGDGPARARWQDVAGGSAFTLFGASMTWGSVRFYRFAERRGLIHPPRR